MKTSHEIRSRLAMAAAEGRLASVEASQARKRVSPAPGLNFTAHSIPGFVVFNRGRWPRRGPRILLS